MCLEFFADIRKPLNVQKHQLKPLFRVSADAHSDSVSVLISQTLRAVSSRYTCIR